MTTVRSMRAVNPMRPARILVIAAHPDDEIIGAGGVIGRAENPLVVHVTDGVPLDPRFALRAGFPDRDSYRRARQQESLQALLLVQPKPNILPLGFNDQQLANHADVLTYRIRQLFLDTKPDLVITHAYEGGHPDHDVTRFAVEAAAHGLHEIPVLKEMTSYHAESGAHSIGKFLDGQDQGAGVHLSETERATKRAMLRRFPSQAAVLAPFIAYDGDERIRNMQFADFSRPPHPGAAYYERFRWGITSHDVSRKIVAAKATLPWLRGT